MKIEEDKPKSCFKIMPCPKAFQTELEANLDTAEKIDCQTGISCEVCYQLDGTILLSPIPKIFLPSVYLMLWQFWRNFETFFETAMPFLILASLTSLQPFYPINLFSRNISWFILIIALFWLYHLFTKNTPEKKIPNENKTEKIININQTFTKQAYEAFILALALAEEDRRHKANIYHLLLSLLDFNKIQKICRRLNLDARRIAKEIKNLENQMPSEENWRNISANLRAAFFLAYQETKLLHANYIDIDDLFLAVFKIPGFHQKILSEANLQINDLEQAAFWNSQIEREQKNWRFWENPQLTSGGVNRDWTGTITPLLDFHSQDLTKLAQKGKLPEIVDWIEEIASVEQVLARRSENNALIVGPAGCGKTAIVQKLAQKIISGESATPLVGKRIVSLDIASLVADARDQGELEGRIKTIIHEITISGNVIIFIDNLENLAILSGESRLSALSAFQNPLKDGQFQCLAATTQENLTRHLSSYAAFLNCFQVIPVDEPKPEEALSILFSVARRFEKQHQVFITYPAIKTALQFATRYVHDRVLPDSAASLLDEASVQVIAAKNQNTVGSEDIARVVSQKTHVPVSQISKNEAQRLLNLEDKIHERLIDQNEAVKLVSSAIKRARTGLKEEKRPVCSFLFLGPTGVGKTELAKTLAQVYFGSENQMIRLDMSEYQEKSSLSRLIGTPPQKEEGTSGELTETVRRNPFSLVLLDEFEKAHPDILNLFLAVIDDGRLTDAAGHLVDFSNTIIIATSNACSELIQKSLRQGQKIEEMREPLMIALQKIIKPELINRFDAVVLFKPLGEEEIRQIAQLQIKSLANRLNNQSIKFSVSPTIIDYLVDKGSSVTFGARPLKRLIQDKIETVLAQRILEEKIKRGDIVRFELSDLPS